MEFDVWMAEVDQIFIDLTGLGRDDWPDSMYWDHWEAGYRPVDAVAIAIEEEYGEEGLEAFGL